MSLQARHLAVRVNHDHLRGLTRCHPSVGIAELIWNSLDADAKKASVSLRDGPMGGVELVEVTDDGTGIDVSRVDDAFQKLGGSWKATTKVSDQGRVLHGRTGKGRFRAASIGCQLHWNTINKAIDGTIHAFGISIRTDDLTDVEIQPRDAKPSSAATGTHVSIAEIHSPLSKAFDVEVLKQRLTEEFGPFLLQYPAAKIEVQGERLDPESLLGDEKTVLLPSSAAGDVRVRLVEWKKTSERRIFLCAADGTTLAEVPMRSHLLDGYVTAYASSEYFRTSNLQDLAEGQVEQLEEMHPILTAIREAVKEYVRERLSARAQASVARWKAEDVYPYSGDSDDPIETVEREVFDIVAVQVDRFLPKFKKAPKSLKKMQFMLLRRALESHPDEVAETLDAFMTLPADERKLLSDLLKRTTLSNIIRATKIVDDRLTFLRGLEAMLVDPDLRDGFLEREHLHELLAKNTWIFGDAYALTASDESLTEAVRRHVDKAQLDLVVDQPILQSDGRRGRVDLMFTRALGAPAHSREHLVVELKRPTVKGGEEIVSQVKKYARALAADARWADTNTKWTFWAVTYELDSFGRDEVNQADRPRGRIDVGKNHVIWLRTWGTLLEECRARMQFLREALEIETNQEAGVRHLQQNYSDSMPQIVEAEKEGRLTLASVRRHRGPSSVQEIARSGAAKKARSH